MTDERTLPEDPRDLAYGQYLHSDGEYWEVVGFQASSGLPIIEKRDREELPDYRTELRDAGDSR